MVIYLITYFSTVKDVTSLLEITVHDEKKGENIGRISIPLLRIRNGEKKWYALKDNSERNRAKGDNPRILIEMSLQWNLVSFFMPQLCYNTINT